MDGVDADDGAVRTVFSADSVVNGVLAHCLVWVPNRLNAVLLATGRDRERRLRESAESVQGGSEP